MEKLHATAKDVEIWGTTNCWSLTSDIHTHNAAICDVELEIQGSSNDGYCLVMSPQGFFTADSWYASKEEAIKNAEELFGVHVNLWKKV